MNDNDKWGWDDEDWEKYEREAEADAKLRAAFQEFQRAEAARNRQYRGALQTEATLVELHIYDLIEDQIDDNAWAAAAAGLEVRELMERLSRATK